VTWAVPILLPTWRQETSARGRVAHAPDGTAEVHYAEGLPPAELHQLLAQEIREWKHLDPHPRGEPEDVITAEGEYAALVSLGANRNGVPLTIAAGFVLGDEPAATIVGIGKHLDILDITRRLLRDDVQLRGTRRRRVRHVAPAGWWAHRVGFDTHYLLRGAQITLFPALPSLGHETPASLAAAAAPSQPLSRVGTAALPGVLWEQPLGELVRTVALLGDGRYTYSVRLDAPRVFLGAKSALLTLLDSIEPLPAPPAARPQEVAVPWLD
jgi:hypothetical protein